MSCRFFECLPADVSYMILEHDDHVVASGLTRARAWDWLCGAG